MMMDEEERRPFLIINPLVEASAPPIGAKVLEPFEILDADGIPTGVLAVGFQDEESAYERSRHLQQSLQISNRDGQRIIANDSKAAVLSSNQAIYLSNIINNKVVNSNYDRGAHDFTVRVEEQPYLPQSQPPKDPASEFIMKDYQIPEYKSMYDSSGYSGQEYKSIYDK
jgi:hypothetical protein